MKNITVPTPYAEFIMEHGNRDYHMGLEDEDAIYIEAILNYLFLAKYFNIKTDLPNIRQLKAHSIKRYGGEHYDLVEGALTEIAERLEQMTLTLLDAAREQIEMEKSYWLVVNLPLVNFINNYDSEWLFR